MPSHFQDVFETISQAYYELTAAERKTADCVLKNRERTQLLSIRELAEESGVAEATVSRFCRRLGYPGYGAFKLAVAQAGPRGGLPAPGGGPVRRGDGIQELARKLYASENEALLQTLALLRPEALERAAAILRSARRVLCMGQGGSMLLAAEAAHLFSLCDGKFQAVPDSHLQLIAAATLCAEDAVFFFSYSGATRDMTETLAVAREQGAKILLMTRFPRSAGAALADVVLPCASKESPRPYGSVPARIAQLFLLDILCTRLSLDASEACAARRQRIAAALEGKRL